MARIKDLLIGVGMSTRGLNRDLGRMRRSFNRSFGEIKRAGRTMSAAISAPLAALGAQATKTFVGFEHSMAKVKAVSGATAAEFAKLESSAKHLGATTIFTAQEVSNLQLILAKMGVSADQIVKVEGAILALAQATDSDLGQAADTVSSTLRAFGKDMDQGQHLADIMAASFSNSALSMDSFSNSMQYVAPVAKAAGVSMEETTSLLAILANNGIRGSKAGRALRRILTDIGATGKPVAQAIKDLADKGLDLEMAMDEVGRSAQTQLLILAENVDQINPLADGYRNADGAAQNMAATMDDTTFGAFKRMSSAIEGVMLSVGKVLAPTLERLAQIVTNAMGMFERMPASMQKMLAVGAALAAAFGPLMVTLPFIVEGFGAVAAIFSGPVLAAIAAVVAAVILIRSKWDEIVQYFTAGPGAGFLNTVFETTLSMLQALIDLWSSVVGFLQRLWANYGDDIVQMITWAFQNIVDAFVRIGNFLTSLWGTLTAGLNGDWETMWQRLYNAMLDAVILILHGAEKLVGGLLTVVDEGLALLGFETTLGDQITNMAEGVISSLDDLKYTFEENTDAAENMFSSIKLGFSQLFRGGGSVEAPTLTADTGDASEQAAATVGPQLQGVSRFEMKPPETREWSTWANGFRDMLGNLTTFQDQLAQSAENMGNAIANGFMAMASGAEDAKEQMKAGLKTVVDTTFAAATAHMIEASVAAGKYSGPAAPIVIPTLIAAGMAMVRGAFGAVTGFADGGIVSGPTMGLVAEYPGARTNPEVIAPLDKLQSMISGGTTNVVGTIRGRDIVLANERGGFSRRRAFG